MRWFVGLLAVLMVALTARASWACEDSAAEELAARGAVAEQELAFGRAVVAYQAALDCAPSFGGALRVEARLRWLRARSEGGFAPLATLERARRGPAASRGELEALAASAGAFPDGPVRAEVRLFAADALRRAHGQGEAAERLEEAIVLDAFASGEVRGAAESSRVRALTARGALADARRVAARAGADPDLIARVRTLERRRALRVGSASVLAAIGVLAIAAVLRRRARQREAAPRRSSSAAPPGSFGAGGPGLVGAATPGSLGAGGPGLGGTLRSVGRLVPWAVAMALWIAVGAGGLATAFEAGTAGPFLRLAAGSLAVVLAARAWSAAAGGTLAGRVARATLCGAGVFAVAFLVLDGEGEAYLASFGI